MNSYRGIKQLYLIIFLIGSLPAFPQVSLQWEKTFGEPLQRNDQARTMVADDLGNVYVTGISAGVNNKADYVTIKYNGSGVQQWVARYDGFGGNDEAQAIAIDASGNIYVTGYSETNDGSYDFATIKYNHEGIQQWVARFNGPGNGLDWAFALKVDKDNNVYVSGFATVLGSSSDCAVVKYNSSGVLQWARFHNGSGNESDVAFAMVLDPVTSDVYVTGNTTSTNGNEDYILIKYNSAGDEQWVRTYNGTGNNIDDARVITLDPQGNVYVSGQSRAPGNIYDCATIKYNASGTLLWVQRYSGPAQNICQPNAMVSDKSGNIYITGFTMDSQNKRLCATLKYNSEGIQQWVQLYSGIPGGDNIGWAIALDSQDNIYVAGESSGSSTSIDYITIKYDPNGVQQWAERYDIAHLINFAAAIAVNKFNEVFVTGSVRTYADIHADYYDYATIKYIQSSPLMVKAAPDTTIYYGYGANCLALSAGASGGLPPYNFSWSYGAVIINNQNLTVCPTTTTVYTVSVTDANGKTAISSTTVKVLDIRCGNQLKKVQICHKGQELCVAASAVAEHLQHGDLLGACPGKNQIMVNQTQGQTSLSSLAQKNVHGIPFEAYPNPARNRMTIHYELAADAYVTIKLFRLTGEEITTIVRENASAGNHTAVLDTKNLIPGIYLCRMTLRSKNGVSNHNLKISVMK
ncbi:MAG: SBBP repeat-containing protein [Flavisolibacter sp.]